MKQKLFIKGGKKVRTKSFDYLAPIGKEELKAATDVIKSKKLSGFYSNFLGGEKVQEFEKKFAEYIGVKYAVALNSGTSALHVALAAAGIGPGDEVIVPPYTFTATASAVLMNNAIPVFVDIEPDTFCIDSEKIKQAITENTRAIIPVHIYGKVANMDEIKNIIKEKNIVIIEDACQAPGCKYKGVKVGSIGDMGCFSFVETKNMVIGEGGMITTNNSELAQRCRLVRNHGEVWMKGKPRSYLSNILGYNFRMQEIEAAIGIEQLKKLENLNDIRKKNADFLQKKLDKFKGIAVLKFNKDEVCHLFPVLFDEKRAGISKEKFMELLNSEGLSVSLSYPHPLYKNPIFQEKVAFGEKGCPYSCKIYNKKINYKKIKCKVAEEACKKIFVIKQVYYPYTVKDMNDIVTAFKKIYDNIDELK